MRKAKERDREIQISILSNACVHDIEGWPKIAFTGSDLLDARIIQSFQPQ